MVRFTKEQRQEIVREFCLRHGQWDAKVFLTEVRDVGRKHPAFDWFEWNRSRAAIEYQLIQARNFANDLKITFTIEEIGRSKAIKLRVVEMPMVISSTSAGSRQHGGGYFLADPDDPALMREYCQQAAAALRNWLNRYGAAAAYMGIRTTQIDDVAARLEAAPEMKMIAAE